MGWSRPGFIDQQRMEKVLTRQRFADERCFDVIAIALGFLSDDAMMRYLEMWAHGNDGGSESPASQSPGD